MPHKKVALQLIEETLKELESPKGSLLSAIQKLQRTSDIINDDDKKIWCAIQLGDTKYTKPITELLKFVIEAENTKNKSFQENLDKRIQELAKLGVKANIHYSDEELTLKNIESGGGYNNI
ncbi:TPA: helix-hairpin-helix domain-containing protein, partial [Escherichia coli]|nr:helix-hairpin-helix domain-containing protein [Escherichia coli]